VGVTVAPGQKIVVSATVQASLAYATGAVPYEIFACAAHDLPGNFVYIRTSESISGLAANQAGNDFFPSAATVTQVIEGFYGSVAAGVCGITANDLAFVIEGYVMVTN
jgi:hypothetical protein